MAFPAKRLVVVSEITGAEVDHYFDRVAESGTLFQQPKSPAGVYMKA
jgi:hypothetical protein